MGKVYCVKQKRGKKSAFSYPWQQGHKAVMTSWPEEGFIQGFILHPRELKGTVCPHKAGCKDPKEFHEFIAGDSALILTSTQRLLRLRWDSATEEEHHGEVMAVKWCWILPFSDPTERCFKNFSSIFSFM